MINKCKVKWEVIYSLDGDGGEIKVKKVKSRKEAEAFYDGLKASGNKDVSFHFFRCPDCNNVFSFDYCAMSGACGNCEYPDD